MDNRTPDDKWIDVLAGATFEENAEIREIRELASLRKTIQDCIENRSSYVPSEAGFSKILAVAKQMDLIKETLNKSEIPPVIPHGDAGGAEKSTLVQSLLKNGSHGIASTLIKRIRQLLDPFLYQSVMESVTSMTVSTPFFTGPHEPALRGGKAGEVTLRVSDPLNISLGWQSDLTKLGIDHATIILDQSHVLIHFALSKSAQDLLVEHDIPPPPGNTCTLVIESNKKF
jgi:hypothetical protein